MKHLWALLTAPAVSAALAVSGVAAAAAIVPGHDDSVAAETPTSSLVPAVAADGFFWQLTAPQDVVSGTLLTTRKGLRSEGTRSDRQFFEISSTGSNDVPEAALRAYRNAEKVMAKTDPDCQISWTLLAAIGRVESNHGRFGGSQLGADGVSRPEIRGPELNGDGAFAAIVDTDDGALDRDKVWDRAVGQMQFLPETWRSVARDADGDGTMNPDDIDDSALGSAVYLCGAGGSLADEAGMSRAAFRYNHSDYYVQLVLSFRSGYETGVFAQPSPPPPAAPLSKVASVKASTKPVTRNGTRKRTVKTPLAQPAPSTSKPTPSATPSAKPSAKPKPTPSPSAPALVTVEGIWSKCAAGYCLGTTPLDLGDAETLTAQASADFDGSRAAETNALEFAGLVNRSVTLQVVRRAGGFLVYVIGDHGYRNADGSFARTVAASQAVASPGGVATP
jgi:membrane-bound lytic murein transglycosylase B